MKTNLNPLEQRVKLTSSCKDCKSIPKIKNAGDVVYQSGQKIQLMFNGLKIHYESYHSPWMNQIISNLKGHHEPQEELVFYHLLKLLGSDSNMIELGCAWAYYSMFFKSMTGQGLNICVEPNPQKLKSGIANVELNGFDMSKFKFLNGFVGDEYLENATFIDWDKTSFEMPMYSIEKLVNDSGLFFDVVHSDIQGAEFEMLNGATQVLDKIGFFVLSTHDDNHEKCLQFLMEKNFSILVQHSIEESFSADGLILAVNDLYLERYQQACNTTLQEYFDKQCKITRAGDEQNTTLSRRISHFFSSLKP